MWKNGRRLAATSLGLVGAVTVVGACADIIGLQNSDLYPGDAQDEDDGGGCAAGFATCGGQSPCATAVLSDPSNCGGCGQVCGIANEKTPPVCAGGACTFTCTAGFAHCSTDPSTGCESELGSDSKNCGACGHDCLGSTCTGGLCAPTAIVSQEADPYAIALDATGVYWTSLNDAAGNTNSSIRTAHKDGTGVQTLAGGQCVPLSLAVTDTAVYWGNQGQCTTPYDYAIVQVNKDGTGLSVLTTAGAPIVSLATSAPALYFDSLTSLGTTDAGVNYWAASTLSAYSWDAGLRTVATAAGPVSTIGATDAGLYWTEQGVPVDNYAGGKVQFLPGPAPSGSPVTLANIVSPYGLALQDSDVYATMPAYDGGAVYQVAVDGGPPTPIVSTPNAGVLLADATHIYWNDSRASGGSIMRARRDGSEVIRLVTNVSYGSFIVMDDQYVYWTQRGTLTPNAGFVSGDGAVLRVAK